MPASKKLRSYIVSVRTLFSTVSEVKIFTRVNYIAKCISNLIK